MIEPASPDPNVVGRQALRRWARPGPPGRRRPAALGSVAAASVRFAAGVARPPRVRRQLAGPGEIRPTKVAGLVAPPRWWTPAATDPEPSWSGTAVRAPSLPRRGLARAVSGMPNAESHVPGAMSSKMTGSTIAVRRIPEVTAAGPMPGASTRLVAPRPGRGPEGDRAGPSGRAPGSSSAPAGPATGRTADGPGFRVAPRTAQRGLPGPATAVTRRWFAGRSASTAAAQVRRAWTGVAAASAPPSVRRLATAPAAPTGPVRAASGAPATGAAVVPAVAPGASSEPATGPVRPLAESAPPPPASSPRPATTSAPTTPAAPPLAPRSASTRVATPGSTTPTWSVASPPSGSAAPSTSPASTPWVPPAPANTTPENSAPANSAPANTATANTAPANTVPGNTVPGNAARRAAEAGPSTAPWEVPTGTETAAHTGRDLPVRRLAEGSGSSTSAGALTPAGGLTPAGAQTPAAAPGSGGAPNPLRSEPASDAELPVPPPAPVQPTGVSDNQVQAIAADPERPAAAGEAAPGGGAAAPVSSAVLAASSITGTIRRLPGQLLRRSPFRAGLDRALDRLPGPDVREGFSFAAAPSEAIRPAARMDPLRPPVGLSRTAPAEPSASPAGRQEIPAPAVGPAATAPAPQPSGPPSAELTASAATVRRLPATGRRPPSAAATAISTTTGTAVPSAPSTGSSPAAGGVARMTASAPGVGSPATTPAPVGPSNGPAGASSPGAGAEPGSGSGAGSGVASAETGPSAPGAPLAGSAAASTPVLPAPGAAAGSTASSVGAASPMVATPVGPPSNGPRAAPAEPGIPGTGTPFAASAVVAPSGDEAWSASAGAPDDATADIPGPSWRHTVRRRFAGPVVLRSLARRRGSPTGLPGGAIRPSAVPQTPGPTGSGALAAAAAIGATAAVTTTAAQVVSVPSRAGTAGPHTVGGGPATGGRAPSPAGPPAPATSGPSASGTSASVPPGPSSSTPSAAAAALAAGSTAARLVQRSPLQPSPTPDRTGAFSSVPAGSAPAAAASGIPLPGSRSDVTARPTFGGRAAAATGVRRSGYPPAWSWSLSEPRPFGAEWDRAETSPMQRLSGYPDSRSSRPLAGLAVRRRSASPAPGFLGTIISGTVDEDGDPIGIAAGATPLRRSVGPLPEAPVRGLGGLGATAYGGVPRVGMMPRRGSENPVMAGSQRFSAVAQTGATIRRTAAGGGAAWSGSGPATGSAAGSRTGQRRAPGSVSTLGSTATGAAAGRAGTGVGTDTGASAASGRPGGPAPRSPRTRRGHRAPPTRVRHSRGAAPAGRLPRSTVAACPGTPRRATGSADLSSRWRPVLPLCSAVRRCHRPVELRGPARFRRCRPAPEWSAEPRMRRCPARSRPCRRGNRARACSTAFPLPSSNGPAPSWPPTAPACRWHHPRFPATAGRSAASCKGDRCPDPISRTPWHRRWSPSN